MGFLQTFLVWAALSGAVFSFPVIAQEQVVRGNEKNPHQPPSWFSRLASEPQEPRFVGAESFAVRPNDFPGWIGRPSAATPKKACVIRDAQGNEKWAFCEL